MVTNTKMMTSTEAKNARPEDTGDIALVGNSPRGATLHTDHQEIPETPENPEVQAT